MTRNGKSAILETLARVTPRFQEIGGGFLFSASVIAMGEVVHFRDYNPKIRARMKTLLSILETIKREALSGSLISNAPKSIEITDGKRDERYAAPPNDCA